MTAAMFEPTHPQLAELWEAYRAGLAPDQPARVRRHYATAILLVTGWFLLGTGLGGMLAMLPR